MLVRDVMTSAVLSVRPDTSLKEVARMLVSHRISGLPVVDAAGAVVGVVSEGDFIAKEGGPPEHHSRFGWLTGAATADHRTDLHAQQAWAARSAGEAMTTPAVTISANAPLTDAARIMASTGHNRLPVVDGGQLVGILTRADVVKTFVRDDDEILVSVRHATRAIDGLRVLAVRDGVVFLGGGVAHPSIAQAVPQLVAHVGGVVGVDATALGSLPAPLPEVTPETVG